MEIKIKRRMSERQINNLFIKVIIAVAVLLIAVVLIK